MLAGPEEISLAVQRLKQGGVVAFPTETVYGLGADAFSAEAVARVFALKGRPTNNPLIVHVSGESMARHVTAAWPPAASALARAFWPGPLSIVLPKAAAVPESVTGGGPNVAVRCPNHPTTLALIEAVGRPLVGPSANPSGGVSPTRADHVARSFRAEDVLVLDGGPCRGGIESTVVDLSGPTPTVLRPGLVSRRELERVLGRGVAVSQAEDEGVAGRAMRGPGRMASHYAPAARTILAPAEFAAQALAAENRGVVITPRGAIDGATTRLAHAVIELPRDPEGYAAGLYAAMRDADAQLPGVILLVDPALGPGDPEPWEAVMDRLRRAAAPR